jgi:hypothetical protein
MNDFQRIASALRGMKPDPNASVFYDLFAGGLVWADEMPSQDALGGDPVAWTLRSVWHYRTSVILGEPAEAYRPSWEEAQKWFPDWPGFHPSRRDPALATTVAELKKAGMNEWVEWETQLCENQVTGPKQATA